MVRLSFALAAVIWAATAVPAAWAWLPQSTGLKPVSRRRKIETHHVLAPFRGTTRWMSTTTAAAATDGSETPQLVMFNSQSRTKEPFRPRTPGVVRMYTCGPTVYDYAHLGNFRAFLTYDLVKRVLSRVCGYDVTHVCNLTDVDDKIINRANEQRLEDVSELTSKFEGLFLADLAALNVVPATKYPRATEHIDDMMSMIRELGAKGLAYESKDGSWYFDTRAQPGYGQQLVQNVNAEEFLEGSDESRNDDSVKKNPQDFCLWKAFKEGLDREDSSWEDLSVEPPIRKGRPGWHLECSAMARRYLGDDTIDLHGGGIDLKFPHHENELAQSEGASGNKFCNCWMHNGFVNIGEGDGDKMSKSLGNFLTLRGACQTPLQVRAYRYLVVSSQYRNPLSFSEQVLKAATKSVKRIDRVYDQLRQLADEGAQGEDSESTIASKTVPQAMSNFRTAILDDLSMPRAAASLFGLVKAAEKELKKEKGDVDVRGLRSIRDAMEEMDQVFGIFYEVEGEEEEEAPIGVPDDVAELVAQRTEAKDAKDWELADSLRARITELGFAVKDVKGGDPIVSRIE